MNRVITALITGGSRGIGSTIAQRLESAGWNVLTPTRNELDLLSNTSIDNYLLGIVDMGIDVIINNAGINPISEISSIQDTDIENTLQTNLVAPIRIIKSLVPIMIQNNYGRIVNISSIWGTVSKPGRTVYAASKSGLNGVTRSMAVELGRHNILVNSVAPGFVETELTYQNNTPEDIRIIKQGIPMQRLAQPAEIAELVYFLVSESNTSITGQTIVIDGGFTCL